MQTPNGACNAVNLNCITIFGPDLFGAFLFWEPGERPEVRQQHLTIFNGRYEKI